TRPVSAPGGDARTAGADGPAHTAAAGGRLRARRKHRKPWNATNQFSHDPDPFDLWALPVRPWSRRWEDKPLTNIPTTAPIDPPTGGEAPAHPGEVRPLSVQNWSSCSEPAETVVVCRKIACGDDPPPHQGGRQCRSIE